MNPIYDRNGQAVAWFDIGLICDLQGRAVAFLDNNNVVSFQGEHLGVLSNGFFRDHRGDAVAFFNGASGGPLLPVTCAAPAPPLPGAASIPPTSPVPPEPAAPTSIWSSLSWSEFISKQKSDRNQCSHF